MIYFLVLDVGCEECWEPTAVIDICFEEEKARSAALGVAADRVNTERIAVKLDEGPPYHRDRLKGQSCIAYWGPIQIHKVEAEAPPVRTDFSGFGADAARPGRPTGAEPGDTGPS